VINGVVAAIWWARLVVEQTGMVGGFVFGRWPVPDWTEQPGVVEPADLADVAASVFGAELAARALADPAAVILGVLELT
jgi:hypothetical protein